jgi:flagellin-like protein
VSSLRGITPVIAIILLLLMTVAAAGSAYIWVNLIQEQITTESQAGLETNLQKVHGQFSIESVWNSSTKLCMTIRNSGTVAYSESQMNLLSVYVNEKPYRYNVTTVRGMGSFRPEDLVNLCLCVSNEATSTNCVGVIAEGYDYTGDLIDIHLEPPIGTGDIYNNFRGT